METTGATGGLFSWQVQYLVNLDDVLKALKRSFCETVFTCDVVLGDHFVRHAQYF